MRKILIGAFVVGVALFVFHLIGLGVVNLLLLSDTPLARYLVLTWPPIVHGFVASVFGAGTIFLMWAIGDAVAPKEDQ